MGFNRTQEYIEFLEGTYFEVIDRIATPLTKSMKENEGVFSFISDRESSANGDNRGRIGIRVSKQLRVYKDLIEKISALEDMPSSEDLGQQIYRQISPLKDYAIKYGYCEEATELLAFMTNKRVVGDLCGEYNASADVVKIIEAYGKRTVLEKTSFKGQVDSIAVDVKFGRFGEDARSKLSIEEMDGAYDTAKVKAGGSVESKTSGNAGK